MKFDLDPLDGRPQSIVDVDSSLEAALGCFGHGNRIVLMHGGNEYTHAAPLVVYDGVDRTVKGYVRPHGVHQYGLGRWTGPFGEGEE